MIYYVAQLFGFFSLCIKHVVIVWGKHQSQLLNADYENLTIVCLSSQKISGDVCGCYLSIRPISFLRN